MRAILPVLMLLAASPALAVSDYDDCLKLVETEPDRAVREAGSWALYGGGGAPARHCRALGLLAIGAPSRAIDELIGAASEEPDLTPEARSALLVQAGELLVEEGDLLTSAVVAEQALRLTPREPSALGLRGAVRVANGDLPAAIRDLDEAIRTGGPDARYLLRRAAAYRQRNQLIPARDDAKYATELSPENASAWLERGRIEARIGDKPAARQSLLQAIELDRAGRIGRTAQITLQKMEAGIE